MALPVMKVLSGVGRTMANGNRSVIGRRWFSVSVVVAAMSDLGHVFTIRLWKVSRHEIAPHRRARLMIGVIRL